MLLSIASLLTSIMSYSLHHVCKKMKAEEDDRFFYRIKMILVFFSQWIARGWAGILGLFLISALLSSKRDQEALRNAAQKTKEAAAEKGKKAAGKAAGGLAQRLDTFAKKME